MLRAIQHLFTPLVPDDYLTLVDPLWTTKELRGRVVRIEPQGADAATVLIRPGYQWQGHAPGQYVRLGVLIDGRFHWRAYSLTSDPDDEEGLISVTPKLVDNGVVSPHLVRRIGPGDVVHLGDVEGTFTLPEPPPTKSLFISAGSGVTPIISMLRSLDRRGALDDVVVIHSARTERDLMFGPQLRDLDRRNPGLRLQVRLTSEKGRIAPTDLDTLCPDWREREAFCSGPEAMLDELVAHWNDNGRPERMHLERFQPVIGGSDRGGGGGTVCFLRSDVEIKCPGDTPILVAGETEGLKLPFGCRIGICHTCIGHVRSGRVHDLRTGQITDAKGQMVRTCVNTAEGDIQIEL